MDLHEVYERAVQAARAKSGDVVTLRVGDHRVHHCGCGYETELLEVMAIHQVRVHNHPHGDAGAFNPPRLVVIGVQCSERIVFYESDQPEGPWTRCDVVTKRYATMRLEQ